MKVLQGGCANGKSIKTMSNMRGKSIPKVTENHGKNDPEKVMGTDAPNRLGRGGRGQGREAAVAILGGPYYATCSAKPRRGTPSQARPGEARREGG